MRNKLLFVIPSLGTGGAELQTINQINYIDFHKTKEVYLASLTDKVDNIYKLKISKKNVITIEGYKGTTLVAGAIKNIHKPVIKLLKFLRSEGIDSVIAVSPLSHLIMRIVKIIHIISFGKKIQLLCYYRDVYYDVSPPDTFFKKLFDKTNSLLARLSDNKTLFISNAVYENIKANFFTRMPLILSNSLPLREVSKDNGLMYLKDHNLDLSDRYFILFPGRLHFKKGHIFFIRAFHKFLNITQTDKNIFFVLLAGEGPERNNIEVELNRLELDDIFFLSGDTENDLLLSLYKLCDLVIIPSIHEGFGNVAIEALMQQCLILTSDTGGLNEIIIEGENGFKFKSADEDDLITKLNYIYINRHLSLISKDHLSKDFLSKYTLEAQINKILSFIDR